MSMTNEPTTGEIVRALRCVAEATECKDCRYKYPVGNVILCDHEQMNGNAADRIERQEHENASLRAENKGLHKEVIRRGIEIKDLTARAESAEARERAAIADMQDNCQYCVGYEREADEPPCSTCYNARTFEPNDVQRTKNWKWRGLQPKEGGGK